MIRKAFITTATAALALSGAGLAVAAGGDRSPQAGGPGDNNPVSQRAAAKAAEEGTTNCNGGKQKATFTQINTTHRPSYEGSDFLVPGASIKVQGPKNGQDVLNITFSAETQLRGSAQDDFYDWMELEVLVDGTPVQPWSNVGLPLAFHGSPYYASNSAQFCTKIGPGLHTVEVVTRLVDNGELDDTLVGWMNDSTLHVVKSG